MVTTSVILPTKNVQDNIAGLLASVYHQEFDGEIETIILDSSTDATAEIAQQFPVRFINVSASDYNYGATRNYGASLAKGNYIVFLSADVAIKDPRWLTKLLNPFDDSRIAGVYGRQHPKADASPMEEFFIQHVYTPLSNVQRLDNGRIQLRNRLVFSNTNSAIRRTVWEKIKLPEMLMSEDQEWAKRALLAGYSIAYAADSVVYHSHVYSLITVFQRFFDSGATLPFVYSHKDIDYPKRKFLTEGLVYLKAEYQYLISHGYAKHLSYAALYELMRFMGYLLGTQYKLMPRWLKRTLCNNKNHWKRYDDIIMHPFGNQERDVSATLSIKER